MIQEIQPQQFEDKHLFNINNYVLSFKFEILNRFFDGYELVIE